MVVSGAGVYLRVICSRSVGNRQTYYRLLSDLLLRAEINSGGDRMGTWKVPLQY